MGANFRRGLRPKMPKRDLLVRGPVQKASPASSSAVVSKAAARLLGFFFFAVMMHLLNQPFPDRVLDLIRMASSKRMAMSRAVASS